ncbi:hypothetical protein GCK72_013250 [Caenorhabditis remanei]|uniref:DUF1248 domain-containing protein n=1 Tax=Caenorhabditis remanei TaxID=31234 RepID=A0A6A5GQI8_CAERE|nr:hypothetical protein GCK72_013250 [Caenorhabditis remanei]KAF1756796.1 hypothetical protein GCK72_013250 [Caenorhabditis remanei]
MFSNSVILGRRLLKVTPQLNAVRTKYLTADGKPRDQLTMRNVDIIVDPNENLIDEFMNGYGKQRLNFERSDIDMWKRCFKDNYSLVFYCLKDTNTLIQTSHHITFHPLPSNSDLPHQYDGFFWIHPDYRGSDSMRMTDYVVKDRLRSVCDNALAQCFPQTMNLWGRMFGHRNYGHTQYVSYYKMDEMKVPDDLNTDGILIKNATDVPDEDIVKYDQEVFPYERSKYVLTLLRKKNGFGKVAYDENGKVIGFGTVIIYPSGECVLSPLYADDKRIAQAIFKNILEQIPLDDKRLLRFHVRSVDKCQGGFEWIQPFVKCPIRKDLAAYLTYNTHLPVINYKKAFVNFPYTNCAI